MDDKKVVIDEKYLEEIKFKKFRIGNSYDGRTNRWRLTCPKCNYTFEPLTTMFALHEESCPKCQYSEVVNYNA